MTGRAAIGFADKLSAVCSAELALAKKDPERMGAMIERLCNSLALTIAVACNGNHVGMDNMLEGANSHMAVMSADHARVVRALAGIAR